MRRLPSAEKSRTQVIWLSANIGEVNTSSIAEAELALSSFKETLVAWTKF